MHGIRAWMHRVVNDIVRAGDGTAASNDERRRLYVHVGCAGWHRGVVGHGDEILSYPRGLRHLYRLCCVLYTLFLCLSAPTTLRWLQLRRAEPLLACASHPVCSAPVCLSATVQTNGVVYASTTSNISDATAAGVMYRLDCNTGDRLAHIEAASIDRTQTWPIHSAPVIDNCVDSPFIGIVYMTFGHRIVALDPANLQVLNELTPNDTIAQDPYQSRCARRRWMLLHVTACCCMLLPCARLLIIPWCIVRSLSMGPDCKSLFVQSRSKRLWRIDIQGKDLNSMQMVLRWRCLYSATDSDCCIPPWCDSSYVEREQLSLGCVVVATHRSGMCRVRV